MRERVLKSHFEKLSLATIKVRRYFYQIPGSNEVLFFFFFGKKQRSFYLGKSPPLGFLVSGLFSPLVASNVVVFL